MEQTPSRLDSNSGGPLDKIFDVRIASNYDQADSLAKDILILQPVVMGFDTETTVGRYDNPRCTSLIQFAIFINDQYTCYLFQTYRIYRKDHQIPRNLIKILQSPEIIKVGVDLIQDIEGLKCLGINLRGTVDIQSIARSMKIPGISLADLGKRFIPNFPGKSDINLKWNWDNDLFGEQIMYARDDACWSLMIYSSMLGGIQIHNEPPPEDPKQCRIEYESWVKQIIQESVKPIKFERLVNRTVNAYSPWTKRYTKKDREDRAREYLTQFIKEQLFAWDEFRKEFLPR